MLTLFACVGKDQVTRAVQYNAHARKLRKQAKGLMGSALGHLKQSEVDEKRYNINLNRYSKVVSKIHALEAVGDGVITRLHEAGLKLAAVASRYIQVSSAKPVNAKTLASVKKSLDAAQESVAKLTQEQVLADTDVQRAKLLMDKYVPPFLQCFYVAICIVPPFLHCFYVTLRPDTSR